VQAVEVGGSLEGVEVSNAKGSAERQEVRPAPGDAFENEADHALFFRKESQDALSFFIFHGAQGDAFCFL